MTKYKRIAVLGLQGSGKTTLVKRLIRGSAHSVLDPLHEYGSQYNVGSYDVEQFFRNVRNSGPRIVVLEEASRYLGKKSPSKAGLTYMDEHRHLDQHVVVVCRRPSQLHPDVIELANFLVVFNLPGANDKSLLEAMALGLGEVVRDLREYDFVVVDERRRIHLSPMAERCEVIAGAIHGKS